MSDLSGHIADPLAFLRAAAEGAAVDGRPLVPNARGLLRHLLEAPQVSAMYSITDLARMTGVSASTLTRLAQRLGHPGFGGLQETFRRAVVAQSSYSRRAGLLLSGEGRDAGADDVVAHERANLEELARTLSRDHVAAAAAALADARRVFMIGLRQSFGLAHSLHYVLAMMRDEVRLLGEAGGRLAEDLAHVGPGDVLAAISFHPVTRDTALAARLAGGQGARLVVLTDAHGRDAFEGGDPVLLVPALGPFPFNALAAATTVIEAVLAGVAARLGDSAMSALARHEALFEAFGTESLDDRNSQPRGVRSP